MANSASTSPSQVQCSFTPMTLAPFQPSPDPRQYPCLHPRPLHQCSRIFFPARRVRLTGQAPGPAWCACLGISRAYAQSIWFCIVAAHCHVQCPVHML